MDKRKDAMMVAENGETIKKTAVQAGTAFQAAEKEGPYFQGAVDGLLMRFEAIKGALSGPKATA